MHAALRDKYLGTVAPEYEILFCDRPCRSQRPDFPPTENTGEPGAVSATVQVAVSIDDGPRTACKGRKPVKLKVAFDDERVGDFIPERGAYVPESRRPDGPVVVLIALFVKIMERSGTVQAAQTWRIGTAS